MDTFTDKDTDDMQEATNKNIDSAAEGVKSYVDRASATAKEYAGKATDMLQDKASHAKEKAVAASQKTDNYVKENPWQVAGIAAGVAAIVGFAVAKMMSDDKNDK